ncbi:aquaporin-4 [Myxocyprinus asiaticus]|uniref:aquaporin-4 n=1 Tax=Myxocyprinus asiaticus TaxID=70543 RepID=UPI002222EDB0|nr:aquaporin-4 [Myxocyprinus asiaticus]
MVKSFSQVSVPNRSSGFLRRCVSSCGCNNSVMAAFKGVWTQEFWRAVSGEFLAMLIFVLLSLGSTINWAAKEENPPPPDHVLISLCFGLSIATLIQCFGHISGAHINPAVTAAMVATWKLSLAKGVFYLLAQCLGAVVGAAVLYGVTPAAVRGGLGVTSVNAGISSGHAIVIELIITFELVFTVFATCDLKRSDLKGSSALAIGLSVCISHLFAIPYTGASMNPARSFGPAVIMGKWSDHWVYWVGPLIGGVLAATVYEYLFCPDPDLKRRYAEVLSKGPFQIDPYRVVDTDAFPNDQAQLTVKQATIRVLDMERAEKKERESAGEVLSSV